MGQVLISGHWGGDINPLPALDLVARGFQSFAPTWQAHRAPFGPGRAFVEAMRSHVEIAVLSTAEEADLKVLGARYRAAILAGKTPVVEGGHLAHTDGGVAFLEGLSGLRRADYSDFDHWFFAAIERSRVLCRRGDFYAAFSSARPLFGPSSTLALSPDLTPRNDTDADFNRQWMSLLHQVAQPHLPLQGQPASVVEPGRIAGSGASGGAAAVISVLGGRLISDGDFLAYHTNLQSRFAEVDLVIVLEPELHSPVLAESTLPTLSEAAARLALPVLAIGRSSSLSAHERAEWGIHGVLTDENEDFETLGQRAARTWAS